MIINQTFGASGETASIVVTAPTGSTVTCTTPSGIVLTATEVSGTWTFARIKVYGTYVVTATNGTKTATENVLVDAAEQFDVTIDFRTYLYNEGDEYPELTGGWTLPTTYTTKQIITNQPSGHTSDKGWVYDTNSGDSGTVTKTKNSDNVYLYVSVAAGNISVATMCANNKIDLSNFSNIFIETNSGAYDLHFMARTAYPIPKTSLYQWGGDDSDVVKYGWFTASGNTWSCSLSGIANPSYIGISIGGYNSTAISCSATIKKIWLE